MGVLTCLLAVIAGGASANVNLRMVVWDGDESLRVLREQIQQFERANPGIKVALESVDYRYFFQRLLAQVAGNSAPDVAMMDPQNMQAFARRKALVPLDELASSTPAFNLEEYYRPIVDVFRWQDSLFVLPRDIAPIGLIYYNKKHFQDAGLALPDGSWTWDFKPRPERGSQCFTYCLQQLTKRDRNGKVTRWAFAPSWVGAFTDTVAFSQGARYVEDPAAFKSLNFDDPRVIRSFDFVAQLANKHHWMPSQTELSSVAQTTAVELFISQRASMYQCGIWDVPRIRQSLKPGSKQFFDWDIALAPGYEEPASGKVIRAAPTGGSGYAIMAGTRNREASWRLLQWMAGEPGMAAMAKAGIAQPAIKRLAMGNDWIPNENTPLEQRYPASRIVTHKAAEYVVFPPTASYWTEVSGLVFSKTEPIYTGQRKASEALREGQEIAETRLTAILKEESLPRFNWITGWLVSGCAALAGIFWVFRPDFRSKRSRLERKEGRSAVWFILPWIVGALLFTVGPIIVSLLMSFANWDVIQPAAYRGLGNYQEAVSSDPRFWTTVKVTAIYTAVSVPLGIIVALLLALLLNTKVKGIPLFRTFFYMPALASAVASALIWRKIFQPEGGLLNSLLFGPDGSRDIFGLLPLLSNNGTVNWLGDEKLALPSLIIMSLWGVGGGMVVLLAGLQAIPDYYYEAATLDGASIWAKFRAVTLPLLSPSLFFTLITGVIASFQAFTQAFVMTQGGPNDSTRFYMMHLFEQSFGSLRMGYASALAWLLFLVILVVTSLQWRLNKHVYYEGAS